MPLMVYSKSNEVGSLTAKLPHDPRAILRGISPQHRTEYLDGFFALPVIHPGADVADVRAEMVDDLLNVLQLLRGVVNHAQTGVYFIYLEPIIAFFRDYQHLTENRKFRKTQGVHTDFVSTASKFRNNVFG